MLTKPRDRARDVLLGVLYGDCLGAAYEFQNGPLTGPIKIGMSTFGHPAGRGTDDTETTVAVARGLVGAAHDHQSATKAIADQLLSWYEGRPPDVGGTTANGLQGYRVSGDPRTGSTASSSIANGSLMRSAPFALINDDGADLAVDSSRTTHAHPAVLGCVRVYVWMVQSLLDGADIDLDMIEDVAGADLGLHMDTDLAEIPCAGIGHAIYALDLAIWAASKAVDFGRAMESIIRLGGDTDTNGAICGAVLAARFGFPKDLWTDLDHDRVAELQDLAGKLIKIDATLLERR